MNRPWQGRVNDAIIERIKQELPGAVLRTTFIVGFPGETEAHFQHLVDFVQRHQFDHVGVFTFSPEAEAPASSMEHQVDPEVAGDRRDILMEVQQPIAARKNAACLGDRVDVLIEQEHPETGQLIGRSARFAPEVDGLVYVRGEASLGSMVSVNITAADVYDLYGEVAVVATVATCAAT
jgi:ribosomal protein S12 methylthiotransferase